MNKYLSIVQGWFMNNVAIFQKMWNENFDRFLKFIFDKIDDLIKFAMKKRGFVTKYWEDEKFTFDIVRSKSQGFTIRVFPINVKERDYYNSVNVIYSSVPGTTLKEYSKNELLPLIMYLKLYDDESCPPALVELKKDIFQYFRDTYPEVGL